MGDLHMITFYERIPMLLQTGFYSKTNKLLYEGMTHRYDPNATHESKLNTSPFIFHPVFVCTEKVLKFDYEERCIMQ